MIDQLKWYLINVGMKKYLPMAGMAAITALGTFMAAHQGLMEQWGVNFIAQWSADWLATHAISGPVIIIELDTFKITAAAGIIAAVTAIWSATQHHVTPVPPKPTEELPK